MAGVECHSDPSNPSSLRPHSLVSLQRMLRHHKPVARKVGTSVLVLGRHSSFWKLIGWQGVWYMVGS